jgi:hypothetical protein
MMHSTSKFATDVRSPWERRRKHDPLADECNCGQCGTTLRKDGTTWVDAIGRDLCSEARDSTELHHRPA